MNLFLGNIEVIDKNSPFHKQKVNIQIENNKVNKITKCKNQDFKLFPNSNSKNFISGNGLKISPGWVDMRATFCDPGYEHKEDIFSGSQAALHGGFTGVCILPDTLPLIQNKDTLSYILSKSKNQPITIYPYSALTKNREGKSIVEMIDLHFAGAFGFTDGNIPVSNSSTLLKGLQYAKHHNCLIMVHSEDINLVPDAFVNEGKMSVSLGLKGKPNISEEIAVQRDLKILEYSQGKIHFSHISTEGSVNLIRKAKQKGLSVTCDVAAHQFALNDSCIKNYDSRFKVNPPFRSKQDIHAIIKGLSDNTIDVIVSDHTPQDNESKNVEFPRAGFGFSSLETSFAVMNTYLSEFIPLENIIEKITSNPRKILKIPPVSIAEGIIPDFTIFDSGLEWVVDENNFKSKSHFSAFNKFKLKGKVKYVICKEKCHKLENY